MQDPTRVILDRFYTTSRIFNGYKNEQPIISKISTNNYIECPILTHELDFRKHAEATYEIFLIKNKNDVDATEYVMKLLTLPFDRKRVDVLEGWKVWKDVPYDIRDLSYLNKEQLKPNDPITKSKIFIPFFRTECLKKSGDYICDESDNGEIFTEALISSILAVAVQNGICPHFVDTISMLTCKGFENKNLGGGFYLFMEKLDFIFTDLFLTQEETMNIVFQTLAGLSYMHSLEISHGDLHTDNVMVKKSKNTIFKGKRMSDYTGWKYIIEGKEYILPAIQYVAKIVDFGLSRKYSHPQIATEPLTHSFSSTYDICMFLAYAYADTEIEDILTILADIGFHDIEKLKDFTLNRKIDIHTKIKERERNDILEGGGFIFTSNRQKVEYASNIEAFIEKYKINLRNDNIRYLIELQEEIHYLRLMKTDVIWAPQVGAGNLSKTNPDVTVRQILNLEVWRKYFLSSSRNV